MLLLVYTLLSLYLCPCVCVCVSVLSEGWLPVVGEDRRTRTRTRTRRRRRLGHRGQIFEHRVFGGGLVVLPICVEDDRISGWGWTTSNESIQINGRKRLFLSLSPSVALTLLPDRRPAAAPPGSCPWCPGWWHRRWTPCRGLLGHTHAHGQPRRHGRQVATEAKPKPNKQTNKTENRPLVFMLLGTALRTLLPTYFIHSLWWYLLYNNLSNPKCKNG